MDVSVRLSAHLAERYAIEREIGTGGMATVYLARDLKHNRKVALKVLRAELSAVLGPQRFLTEIEVTANLQHPHILPLFDSGAADGLLFYVMPYVQGETLRQRLEREEQLPVEEAIRIARAVANALDYAHRRGVIHRDLKPENILLHEGEPSVADFGIALAVSSAAGDRITLTGLSLGTPEYMSPEQATGDPRVDARSDVYALGAVLYEMLIGEPPYTGRSTQAIIAKILTERPQPMRTLRETVPEHVDSAVARALARLPADRFATAGEFAEALAGHHASADVAQTVLLRSKITISKVREWAPWAVAAAVGAVVLALGLWPKAPAAQLTRFEIVLPDSAPLRDFQPIVSPDGSKIVYAAGADSALYVHRLDGTETRRLAGTEDGLPQCISADGAWVVFAVIGSGLKKAPIAGGAPVMISDSAGQTRCGDRGELVLTRRTDLWRMSINGGSAELVARPDPTRRHRSYNVTDILPGGRSALITIGKGGEDIGLGIARLDDGTITELDVRGNGAQYLRTGHIVFSRDGSTLAAPFSLRRMRITGPLITVNEPVGGPQVSRKLSPTGTLVYHTRSTKPGRLVQVDRLGNASTFADRVGEFVSPRLSPDGRRVALAASKNNGFEIWIYDIGARTYTPLADAGPGDTGRLEWTRDGRQVAFSASRRAASGSLGIKWQVWDGSRPLEQMLAREIAVFSLSFGPPHSYLVFEEGARSAATLWIAPLDSLHRARPFLMTPAAEGSPRISPSGRLLAYTSNKSGPFEVYVTPLPGPGAHLPVSAGGGIEPIWSPDGRTLYYRGPKHLLSAAIAETPELAVTGRDTLFPDPYLRAVAQEHASYDVFPDGRHFLMMRAEKGESARLFVVVNWTEQLRGK